MSLETFPLKTIFAFLAVSSESLWIRGTVPWVLSFSLPIATTPAGVESPALVLATLPGNLVCCENDWDYHDKRFPPPFVPGTSFALGNVCVSEKGLAVILLQIVLLKEPLPLTAPCAVRGSARKQMHLFWWTLWCWFLPRQWFSLRAFLG